MEARQLISILTLNRAKKNKDYSLVLLVEENCDFYTDREGLVGNNKKQEE